MVICLMAKLSNRSEVIDVQPARRSLRSPNQEQRDLTTGARPYWIERSTRRAKPRKGEREEKGVVEGIENSLDRVGMTPAWSGRGMSGLLSRSRLEVSNSVYSKE